MKKAFLVILGVLIGIFIFIQFIPVKRDNPAVVSDLNAPPEVKAVLKRACYDCHSNETRWLWYSHVAPVAWLVADDVREGRQHLNFSDWGKYVAKNKVGFVKGHIYDEIAEKEMPLSKYLIMHPDAQISSEDLKILSGWLGKTFSNSDK